MTMTVTPKYYRFTDPISKHVTKDVGWIATSPSRNIYKVYNSETHEWDVKQDEEAQSNFEQKPRASDTAEISQSDYAALDVTGESTQARDRRTRHEEQLQGLQTLAAQQS